MCFCGWSEDGLDTLMVLRTSELKVFQGIWLPLPGTNGRQYELGAAGLENGAGFDGGKDRPRFYGADRQGRVWGDVEWAIPRESRIVVLFWVHIPGIWSQSLHPFRGTTHLGSNP